MLNPPLSVREIYFSYICFALLFSKTFSLFFVYRRLEICSLSVADPGFPRGGGANSPGGATYEFVEFSQKLHEIERIWTPGGRVPCAPLRSATVCVSQIFLLVVLRIKMSLVMDQMTLLCNMFSVQSFVFLAVVSNLT